MLSIEEIVEIAESRSDTDIGQRRIANRLMRRQDQSRFYPINNRFNVTNRSIGRANRIERVNGTLSLYEYVLLVDSIIGDIVNERIR